MQYAEVRLGYVWHGKSLCPLDNHCTGTAVYHLFPSMFSPPANNSSTLGKPRANTIRRSTSGALPSLVNFKILKCRSTPRKSSGRRVFSRPIRQTTILPNCHNLTMRQSAHPGKFSLSQHQFNARSSLINGAKALPPCVCIADCRNSNLERLVMNLVSRRVSLVVCIVTGSWLYHLYLTN
ncbi:hypothetical protein IWZ00DRAFT_110084 [Phyllosticta capitalensis]|uniref:uncharacterized protein n=1 Tax=Phyllosticta capitalensis TaxID=121624 RepID=UPI00312FFE85